MFVCARVFYLARNPPHSGLQILFAFVLSAVFAEENKQCALGSSIRAAAAYLRHFRVSVVALIHARTFALTHTYFAENAIDADV